MRVGVSGVGRIIRIQALAVGTVRAVAAQKADIVHERVCTGEPHGTRRAVVAAARVQPDTLDDVVPARRRKQERNRSARPAELGRLIVQKDLRRARVHADKHRARP